LGDVGLHHLIQWLDAEVVARLSELDRKLDALAGSHSEESSEIEKLEEQHPSVPLPGKLEKPELLVPRPLNSIRRKSASSYGNDSEIEQAWQALRTGAATSSFDTSSGYCHQPEGMPPTRESQCSSTLSSEHAELSNNILELKGRRQRSVLKKAVWTFLRDGDSSRPAVWYASIMPVLIMLSVAVTLAQTVEPPVFYGIPAAVVESAFEIFFATELVLSFASCPCKSTFLTNMHNVIDVAAVLPLFLRAAIGFVLPRQDKGDFEGAARNFLLCVVPVLRFLKIVRRFERFRLFESAFEQSYEALPVCLFPLFFLTLVFSALIYFVEPRDNISSLPEAMWLTLVTMTTVGYGDVTPKSAAGSLVVATLVITSLLYTAMPIGIIGQAFIRVWNDRDRIFLMCRCRDRLAQWGYTAADMEVLFKYFDEDQDGGLNFAEFEAMMARMHINLTRERIDALFSALDLDGGGAIDCQEFMMALWPSSQRPS
jgi:hypothetical protein